MLNLLQIAFTLSKYEEFPLHLYLHYGYIHCYKEAALLGLLPSFVLYLVYPKESLPQFLALYIQV